MGGISLFDIIRCEGGWPLKAVKLFDHVIAGAVARILVRRQDAGSRVFAGPQRILVIRPGGIGDAVFLLPIIRELTRLGHTVDVVCERRNAQIFTSQQGLCARVLRYDVGAEFFDIFRQGYDAVVDTEQWHHLSAITAYFVKSRIKVGFSTRPSRARLFDIKVAYDLNGYELTCFSELFGIFGISSGLHLKGSYHVPVAEAAWAKEAVRGEYVVLALGGSIPVRRFSVEQARGICQDVLSQGCQVVLVGGRDVVALAHDILGGIQEGHRVMDLTGTVTLSQSAALIAGARRFVGHDSGLLHLACALGVPVTAIFGTGNKDKWGPRGIGDCVLSGEIGPCTRFGYTILKRSGRTEVPVKYRVKI